MQFFLVSVLAVLLFGYALLVLGFWWYQERLIFHPQQLTDNHDFYFDLPHEEIWIPTTDGHKLHGLMFRTEAEKPKGLVFYLHGNAGSMNDWGHVAPTYCDLGYDVFLLDYRGYGKSSGRVKNERQFFADAQKAYNAMAERYEQQNIVVLGYSIGSGTATYIAAHNSPRMLILQTPYYSLPHLVREKFSLAPTYVMRYKFATYKMLKSCRMPVVIFHGDNDTLIPHHHALRLQKLFKPTDKLIILADEGHNGITDNPDYKKALLELLK
jgi:pimeloyl-ACP methyl ester carboxylesterase